MEQEPGRGPADQSDMGSLQPLLAAKGPSPEYGEPDGIKVPRVGTADHNIRHVLGRHGRMLDHAHRVIATPAFAGRHAHQTGTLDPGDGPYLGEEMLKESNRLDRLLVAGLGQTDVHGEHVLDRNTDVA